jgi:serine/threonine protein kinase
VAEAERGGLLRELLALELDYRKQLGERPTREEYRAWFREYGELLETLFAKSAEAGSLHPPETGASEKASYVPAGETGAELPSTDAVGEPELPSITGYEILGELGRGAMGVVYKARHIRLKRIVALKMILGGGLAGPEHLARFRTEAEAVARLQHPHIVQIYEIGEHNGLPFLALEFVDGGSLSAKLAGNPQQPAEAARVVETLADAMHAAHQAGVVLRDLKPAKVLLTTGGAPKVTDFGLAKQLDDPSGLTRSRAIMGTPSYMAPEQAAGSKEIGPAADVYALGAILYECLTGRSPFRGATVLDTLEQVRT